MPRPRSELICLSDTPFYHCVSRCVRRAFLCGTDRYSGQCYEHRREWLEQKLLFVADVFAIKVCSYAIMSNHYHVVLHVRPDIARKWSSYEVVERWHQLFSGTPLSSRFLANNPLTHSEEKALKPLILLWRNRLLNISWLMRIVNESIARQANSEDDCTGSFWEGRFKSQALLDERALLSCMAYVDLNPVRAQMATTPQTSDFTSIQSRIKALKERASLPNSLEIFVGYTADTRGVPYSLNDYIDLVEWTGRVIHPNKTGFVSTAEPNLLKKFNIDIDTWTILTTQFEKRFNSWVGSEKIVQSIYKQHKYQRKPSTRNHQELMG